MWTVFWLGVFLTCQSMQVSITVEIQEYLQNTFPIELDLGYPEYKRLMLKNWIYLQIHIGQSFFISSDVISVHHHNTA